MKTIKNEYGYMLQIGALFPNLRPSWRFLSIIQTLFYITITVYHFFMLMYTTAINYKDLNSASQTLHYAALLLITIAILLSFPLNRPVFVHMIRIVGNNYYTYSDGLRSDLVDKWNKDNKKNKIVFLLLVPIYLFFCAISLMFITPMIDSYQGFTVNEDYIDNLYTKLPVKVWYPYTIDNNIKHMITLMLQISSAVVAAAVISCADLLMLFISQGIAVQLQILRHSIQNLETRAEMLYEKLYKNGPTLKKKLRYSNELYMKMINLCIKENVQHHKIILSAFNDWYLLQKWPMVFGILEGSLIIALSILGYLLGEARFGSQLLSLLLLFAEIANMALFCGVGQQMTNLNEEIVEEWYNLNWMRWNKSCKLSLLIVKERFKVPLELKAGGLKALNRDTLGSILNGAYSYFNLIYAYIGEH
ncbi:uncharacterized protein [Rhodnius prolixus]